jgi:hypothetical protein
MEQRGLHQSRTPCPAPTCSLLLSLSHPDLCARHRRSALTPPRLSPSLAEDPLPPPPTPPHQHPGSSTAPTSTPVHRPPWLPPLGRLGTRRRCRLGTHHRAALVSGRWLWTSPARSPPLDTISHLGPLSGIAPPYCYK